MGEYTGVELSGGNFPGGRLPRTEIFANLIQTLTSEARVSIQKHAGCRSAAPVGGVRVKRPT